MEGTKASLARNVRSSEYPTLNSNFNSRIQTQTSILLTDADPYGVPYPANYMEPTEEQLNMTQPVPEEIVSEH